MDRNAHVRVIDQAIQDLLALSRTTSVPASLSIQYIGTTVDNTAVLLTSVGNSLDSGARRLQFSDDSNWISAMQAVHRSFYSSALIGTEMACVRICQAKKLPITVGAYVKAEQFITTLKAAIPDKAAEIDRFSSKVYSLAGKAPTFNDYLRTVIEASAMTKKQAKIWYKYFRALCIVRNKASHAIVSLSEAEIKDIRLGGLGPLIAKNNELHFNPSNYIFISNHLIQFFNELNM